MEEIVDGTKDKVKNEIEIIETKYLVKLKKVNIDVDSMKEELTLKCEEISQHKKEYKILEEEFERIKKGNINLDESSTTKLLILEKNLESTFQKLVSSAHLKIYTQKLYQLICLVQYTQFFFEIIQTSSTYRFDLPKLLVDS